MPADRFTKKATTPKLKRMWSHIEKSMLDRGASKGAAIRAASGRVAKMKRKSRRGKRY